MAFTWTQDISVGSPIESADIIEIRNNADITDNKKCSTYYSTVYGGVQTGIYSGVNTGVNSSYGSACTSYYGGVYSNNNYQIYNVWYGTVK